MMEVSKAQRTWQVVLILENESTYSIQCPWHMLIESLNLNLPSS